MTQKKKNIKPENSNIDNQATNVNDNSININENNIIKKKIHPFIKFILIISIFIILLISALIGLWQLIPLSKNYICKYLSYKSNLNVSIGNINASWGDWKPKITIYDIKAQDTKNNKIWFKVDNIDLLFSKYTKYGINLPSTNFSYININNPYILCEQNKTGWTIFNQKPKEDVTESLPSWLFHQDSIKFNNAKIECYALNGNRIPISANTNFEFKKIDNNSNYLVKLDANLSGINIKSNTIFSPIYKADNFLGYFKEWKGESSSKINLNLNKEDISEYTQFLLDANFIKNIEKFKLPIKEIIGEFNINTQWEKTSINNANININLNKIDGKMPNALKSLMPNFKADISLNQIDNSKQSKQDNNKNNNNNNFTKQYYKDLPAQNYIWKVNSINWDDSEVKNIIISHPTHNLLPISIDLENSNTKPFIDVLNRINIPTKYQHLIDYINPRADIKKMHIIYDPKNKKHEILNYAVNADLQNIQFNYPATKTSISNNEHSLSMLGKNGFNLKFQGTFEHALAKIMAKNVSFQLPKPLYNNKNIDINLFDADLKWNIDKKINLNIDKIILENDNIKLNSNISYQKENNTPAKIDIAGNINSKNIKLLNKYLPDNLPENIKQIIKTMDIDAEVNNTEFSISGNDNQFRNNLKEVKFNLNAAIKSAKFSIPYLKHENEPPHIWPRFENINGKLVISNDKQPLNMFINVDNALATTIQNKDKDINNNLKIDKTQISLTSFTENPILTVNAESTSSLNSMLNYINTSPLHNWIGNLNFKTAGNKDANLNLKLNLPLKDLHSSTVDGVLKLENNDIEFISSLPVFNNVNAILKFNQKGFSFEQASANFMGEDITASGYSKDKEIHINADGILSKNGIESAKFKSALSKIPKYMQGQTPYKAKLSIVNHQIKVDINTDLNGMAIFLPEPLAKKEQEIKKMHFSWHLIDPEKHIEKINVSYDNFIGAIIEQKRENGISKNIRGIYYADNNFDNDVSLPDEGIQAKVNLNYINADAWRSFYSQLQKDLNNNNKVYSEQISASKEEAELYLPARIAAYTKSLRAMDREIKNIILGISRQDDGWAGNISSSHINGYIKIHPASTKHINGLVEGHFSKLNIPDKEQKEIIANLFQEKIQDLPALDIKVDEFTMLKKSLGSINLNAFNEYKNHQKIWYVKKFSLENNDANLSAKGYWNYIPEKNSNELSKSLTNLDINLSLKNVGNFLNLLGATQVVKGGNGAIDANLKWQGSPLEFNYQTLNSDVKLNIMNGNILKVDPAAAKLLGIISLQGLGNILTFNWNKLFAQGSPFDDITSSAIIKNGILSTNDFKLNSPQAKVSMSGNINLLQETQNLQADIYPKINAGSASLAYSIINPAIGLGTLIAQVALSNPLSKILKQSYMVSGKWDNPKVKKISNINADDDEVKYKTYYNN